MTRAALLGGAALLGTAPAQADTLRDAIAAAYATNPTLAEAQARQEALEEAPEQARAEGRPSLSAVAGAGYDDLGRGSASSADLQAAMPIWTGGRVSSAVRASSADVAAGAQVVRDNEAAVLEQVVAAYADLLFAQEAVEVARIGIERLDRQIGEAQSRFDLGEATRTDVAQLQAQRSSVVANLADAEAALASARAAYRAVVGEEPGALEDEVPPPGMLPADLADARAAAELANPRLLERLRIVDASRARIDRARADGAPSIELAGAYGRGVEDAGGSLRDYDSAASVGVTLRIPLLTGGLVASRVREAEATARADRYAVQFGRDRLGHPSSRKATRNGQPRRVGSRTDRARRGARGIRIRPALDDRHSACRTELSLCPARPRPGAQRRADGAGRTAQGNRPSRSGGLSGWPGRRWHGRGVSTYAFTPFMPSAV